MADLSRLGIPSLLVATALMALGCGGGSAALCEKLQQCYGGNDADFDACLASTDGVAAIAAAYDCSDQYDKLIECTETKGTCSEKRFSADCNDEGDSLDACQEAASAKK